MQIVMPITRSRAAVLHRSHRRIPTASSSTPGIGRNIVGAKWRPNYVVSFEAALTSTPDIS